MNKKPLQTTLTLEKVLKELSKIPKGKLITYKQLAKKFGSKAYRRVGTLVGQNPHVVKIPCHRVVNSSGKVGGYSDGGTKRKIQLLKAEGIEIKDQRVVNLENYFCWK